jgi:nucleoside-diphosphate-sugar epimerase
VNGGRVARRALVTGSDGMVGRHMDAELERRGWHVDVCDVAHAGGVDCLDMFRDDYTVYDLVVHCAAREPHRLAIDTKPATSIYNRLLDAAMFEWAVRTGQRRVLYLSSSAVYPAGAQRGQRGQVPYRLVERDTGSGLELTRGLLEALGDPADIEPADAYGWTKRSGEQMAAAASAAGVPTHVVRPFSGYGEDQGELFPFGAFVARARRREDPFMIWGDGQQVRDWIHIDDVVAGALAVALADERRPVNLCTGVGTSMVELAEMVCAAAGYRPGFRFDRRAPGGVAYRVGYPDRLGQLYEPRVSLADGVARAFTGAAAT